MSTTKKAAARRPAMRLCTRTLTMDFEQFAALMEDRDHWRQRAESAEYTLQGAGHAMCRKCVEKAMAAREAWRAAQPAHKAAWEAATQKRIAAEEALRAAEAAVDEAWETWSVAP